MGILHKTRTTAKIDKVYEASMVNPIFFSEDIYELPNSTKVKFYMDSNLVFISSSCNSLMLRNLLNWYDKSCVAVIHSAGNIMGIVTREYLEQKINLLAGRSAGSVAIPWNKVKTVSSVDNIENTVNFFDSETPVVMVLHKNRPVGVLTREMVFSAVKAKAGGAIKEMDKFKLAGIVELFPEAIVILDQYQRVVYHNKLALKLVRKQRSSIVGEKFEFVFGWLFAKCHSEFLEKCPLGQVIETCLPVNDREQRTCLGTTFLMNYFPIIQKNKVRNIAIIFRDVTLRKIKEETALNDYEELTHAFRLMLPNIKIEKRLKAIPEYKDHFDHNTGFFEIVDVIPDGAYRHVINCLKITSELHEKGVFTIPGIDRNTVVLALITHDLGKKQPRLNIGEIIDPKECFMPGKIHAKDSAEIIAEFPAISPEVVQLVQYHHHEESELPADFPDILLPMLRLVRLVDGLSAGITRRDAEINLTIEENSIVVYEKNANITYNGIRELDLITGEARFHRFAD